MTELEDYIAKMLELAGLDPNDPELKETPRRMADMYKLCLKGKDIKLTKFFERPLPTTDKDLTVIGPIPFFSLCPHHMLPYFGRVYISYIPHGKIIGLSKFHSLVEAASQKPQLQEQFKTELVEAIEAGMKPYGVMVVIFALHTCMFIRGRYDYTTMSPIHAETVQSAVRGVFAWNPSAKQEALRLIEMEERRR